MSNYKVVEKFVSINGEAKSAGELACFIRFAGCNLCCSYCDTMWANDKNVPYTLMDENEIYNYIKSTGVKRITLTGGEPLLQEGFGDLLIKLCSNKDWSVEIETNGAVSVAPFVQLAPEASFTLDYKLPGSGMSDRMVLSNYENVREKDCVKFVVSNKEDLDEAKRIVETYHLTEKTTVYFSSAFQQIMPAQIVDYMMEHKLTDVKLQLQLHKYIWDPEKRGV